MVLVKLRRLWRRTMAQARYTYYRHLTRRTTRLMRRSLAIIILVIMALALYDLRQPEHQRLVKREAIRKSFKPRAVPIPSDPRKWPTWRRINKIFVFGDSHSDTGFNPHGLQPDPANPLGNPFWPGITSSYGVNFIGHMTATFNQSFIKTYNLAHKAAAIRERTDKLNGPPLDEQIENKFLGRYGQSTKVTSKSHKGFGEWSQVESLFVIYLGVDDIFHTTVARVGGRNSTAIEANIEAYRAGMEKIYEAGGRNFLLINIPQLEEAPFMRNSGIINYIWDFGAEIVQYNGQLAFMAHRFAESYSKANVFVFDNHKLSLAIRREPSRFHDTASYVRINGFCFPYVHDIWWSDTHRVFDEQCEVPLDGWYWRDNMHFTEPYHKLMARQIVELLNDPRQRLPLEFY